MSSAGWRPQLGAYSVAVAHVEQLWVTRPEQDVCRPCCPLWVGGVRHSHFFVEAGLGFLGALEKFASGAEGRCRTYDFTKIPDSEMGEELAEVRKAGELVTVSAPVALFAPSRWSGLSPAQARIIQALVGEVTRAGKGGAGGRSDKAHISVGAMVPGRTATESVCCPLLRPNECHVAFCGNGRRRGLGYLIVGRKGGGWLGKCGYPAPDDATALAGVIREFFADLAAVRDVLGLSVVALDPDTMRWSGLEDLVALARSRRRLPNLLEVHLRIYGPEDYRRRCRTYLADKGRFSAIPGGEAPGNISPAPIGSLDLAARVRLAGIKQVELAEHLDVSQPYVAQVLNGDRPWPDWARESAEAFVARRLAVAGNGQ